MFILFQTLLFLICTLFIGFLLVEGWLTKGVWVKSWNKGIFANVTEMESWAVKKHLGNEPQTYWTFMGIYAVAFLIFLLMLLF